MMSISIGNYEYLLAENRQEDLKVRKLEDGASRAVNTTDRDYLVPWLADCSYLGVIGCNEPMDTWDRFDLRLYAEFRRLAQHFITARAVLARQDMSRTNLLAVYSRRRVAYCGCAYCRGGIIGLTREINARPPEWEDYLF